METMENQWNYWKLMEKIQLMEISNIPCLISNLEAPPTKN